MKHPILIRSVSMLLALVMLLAYPASAAEITALTDADTSADSSDPFDDSTIEESSGEASTESTSETADEATSNADGEDAGYLDEDGNYLAPEDLVVYVTSYLTEGKNARVDASYTGIVAFYDYNETDEEERLDNPYFFYYEDGVLQDEEALYISSDRFLNLSSAPTTAEAASISDLDGKTAVYSAEEVYANYQDEEATEHPEYLFAFNVEGQANGLYTGYSDVMGASYENGEAVVVEEISLTQNTDGTTPKLTWSALSDAVSYKVYRKTGSGSWSVLASGITATSYTDTKATVSGTAYSYYVTAILSNGSETVMGDTVTYTYREIPSVSSAAQAGGVKVSWNSVSDATGYRLYRKVSGGSWQRLTDITSGSTVSYVDASAVSGKVYYYTVRAYFGDDIANSSNYKLNDWSGYTSSASLFYVAAPEMQTAYYNSSSNGITVSWTKVSGVTGYRVYRKTASSGWTKLTTITGGSTVTYLDTTAAEGETYYYTVRAYIKDSAGTVTWSYFETPGVVYSYYGIPQVTATVTTTGIKVSWTKDSAATGYRLYRKISGGSWATVANIADGSTVSYTDTSAVSGKVYYYTVRAYYGSDIENDTNYKTNLWSGYQSSSAVCFVTAPVMSEPYSVTKGMQLTWTAVSGASGYRIYRRSSTSDSWTQVTTISGGTTSSYVDTSVKENGTYYYTIRAYIKTSTGTTYWSWYITPSSSYIYHASPVATVASTSSGIKLTWTQDTAATGYRVFRKISGGSWVIIANITGNDTTSLVDEGDNLTSGKTYYYAVRAYYGSGEPTGATSCNNTWSGYTAVSYVYLTTPVLPSTASNNSSDTNGIKVTWEAVSGAAGYYIYRKTSSTGSWSRVGTVSSGSTVVYLDTSVTSLAAGTTCYYTVRAFDTNKTSLSYFDTTGSMCIYLPMPQNLTVGVPSSSGTKITWSAVGGATSYIVYRRKSTVSTWTNLATVTTNSYTDTTVTSRSTIYYYCVVSIATATVNDETVTFRGTYDKTGMAIAISWSGSERNTWVKKDNEQYYVQSNGTLALGWQYKTRNGSTYKYYFDPSTGKLVTNLYSYFGKSYRDIKCRIITCVSTSSSKPSYTAIYLYNSDTGAYDTPAAAWRSIGSVENTFARWSSLYLAAGGGQRWLTGTETGSAYEQYAIYIHGTPSWFHSTLYRTQNYKNLYAYTYNNLERNVNNSLGCIRMQCIYAFLITDLTKNGYGKSHRIPVVLYKTSSVSAFGVPHLNKISTSKKYDPTDPAITGKFFYATSIYGISTTASSTTWVYY